MRILLTILLTLIVVAALGVGFIYSGVYDVAAAQPDNPLFARLVHETSERSVAARKGAVTVPAGYDAPENVASGAKEYGETCVICHGGPGLEPSAISKGLNPGAPRLYRQGRDPDPQEDYWFVANGVKMTAMPAFAKSLDDKSIWDVVAFLKTLPGMSPADFTKATGATGNPATAEDSSGAGGVPNKASGSADSD